MCPAQYENLFWVCTLHWLKQHQQYSHQGLAESTEKLSSLLECFNTVNYISTMDLQYMQNNP